MKASPNKHLVASYNERCFDVDTSSAQNESRINRHQRSPSTTLSDSSQEMKRSNSASAITSSLQKPIIDTSDTTDIQTNKEKRRSFSLTQSLTPRGRNRASKAGASYSDKPSIRSASSGSTRRHIEKNICRGATPPRAGAVINAVKYFDSLLPSANEYFIKPERARSKTPTAYGLSSRTHARRSAVERNLRPDRQSLPTEPSSALPPPPAPNPPKKKPPAEVRGSGSSIRSRGSSLRSTSIESTSSSLVISPRSAFDDVSQTLSLTDDVSQSLSLTDDGAGSSSFA